MSRNWIVWVISGLCAILVGSSALIAQDSSTLPQPAGRSLANDDEYFELMQVFVDTFEQIDRNYVSEIDRRDLMEAAIRGMIARLDPYSDYISPQELARFNEELEQQFGGVGIQVQFDPVQRNIEIMSPLPGSPAYRAGLRAGDRIVTIEGKPVEDFPVGLEIETAISMLKGEPGVVVTVAVRRAGSEQVEDFQLTREIIQLDTVLGDTRNDDGTWDFMLDDERKIGYIRLTHFTRRTAVELRSALNALRAQGMRGLILDLRFNPGGLLDAAIEICDMFVENGVIVSTQGRNVEERIWNAKRFGTFRDFPMAVLINRYSASASEIVSACLQDHQRAIIVGERSWGKASVQNVIELEGGDSQLKLTTAGYHRPSGQNIHRSPGMSEDEQWGVMPDDGYQVRFNFEEMRAYHDDRRARDVLGTSPPERSFRDTQFEKALEYIISQIEPGEPKTEDPPAQPEPAGSEAEAKPDETSLNDSRSLEEIIESLQDVIPLLPRPFPRVA